MGTVTRFVRLAIVALACFLPARSAAAAAGRPTVLVLDSYGGSWETARQVAAGLRRDVHGKNGAPLEFVEVSLRPGTEGVALVEEPLLEYVNGLFREEPPVLVVALGRAAGQFVFAHRERVFPATPSLTLLAIRPDFASLPVGTNDAFVSFEFDLPWAIDTLLNAFPGTHRLFVVFGHTAAELRLRDAFKPFFAAQYPNLAVMWANDLTLQGLADSVAQLPSDSVVIYGGFDVDASNERVEDVIALPRVLASASVPTVAVYQDKLGTGIAATTHADIEAYVREASGAARSLLAGTPPASLRSAPSPTMRASFDARALARFGIPRSRLPATAQVVNEPSDTWSDHAPLLAAGAVLIGLQVAAGLALAFGWRRARARRDGERAFYIQGSRLREGIVERRASEARHGLTRRIGQISALAATRARAGEASSVDDLGASMRDLGARLADALTRIAPAALDDLGLEAALRTECAARREASSLDVLFSGRAPAVGLSHERALALLRALQALLDVSCDDPTARTVTVSLVVEADRAQLRVEDPRGQASSFARAVVDAHGILEALGGGTSVTFGSDDFVVTAWVPAGA